MFDERMKTIEGILSDQFADGYSEGFDKGKAVQEYMNSLNTVSLSAVFEVVSDAIMDYAIGNFMAGNFSVDVAIELLKVSGVLLVAGNHFDK